MLVFSRAGDARLPLDAFRELLDNGATTACLLTPTASLAEQIRSGLAREGYLVRPDSVVTLSRFVEPLVRDLKPAHPALIERLVVQELAEAPEVFRSLSNARGLQKMLAQLVDEFAGALPGQGTPEVEGFSDTAEGFLALYRRMEAELQRRGLYLRNARLREAASRLRAQGHPWRSVNITGFHGFTPAERQILLALAPAELRIAMPETSASEATRDWLALHWKGVRVPESPLPQAMEVMPAASEAQEVEAIATRVLELWRSGAPFREIGIVLRSEQPYRPLVETTFERFGIPARFYFQPGLSDHPSARFLLQFLDALLSGWEYEALLPLVAALGPSFETDALDHWLRSRLPGAGLPEALQALPRAATWASWERLRDLLLTPAEWAGELAGLLELIPLPAVTDRVEPAQVLAWRREFAAREAWPQALQLCAEALPGTPLDMASFRKNLGEVLPHLSLQDRDARREAVAVLDAYEARQWQLPVVFLCGLVERVFPRYHTQHPILTDADRERLRAHGVVLRTSGERQRDESDLFDAVLRSSRDRLVLSYPRANPNGEELLASFLLTELQQKQSLPVSNAPLGRPPAIWAKAEPAPARIFDRGLLARLRQLRAALSPTSIESYLQCPFQFFGRYLLDPEERPPYPQERLDLLLQGNILHQTLAHSEGSPLFVEEIFLKLFEEECEKEAVPRGWRKELARLELRRNLLRFVESPPLRGARTLRVENSFDIRLRPDLRIRGKIDRLAEMPERGMVVIDYKYSSAERVRSRVRSHARGELVQGGLYLWAAQKLTKLRPAAMLYCGLRGEVSWAGWHVPMFGWHELGEAVDASQLDFIINRAVEISLETADRIVAGEIQPSPSDEKKCAWCECRDVCRVECSVPVQVQMAGGMG